MFRLDMDTYQHVEYLGVVVGIPTLHFQYTSLQVYLFYNQKIIDPCGTYIQSQVNTGINIGIIYN